MPEITPSEGCRRTVELGIGGVPAAALGVDLAALVSDRL
jgi:hypothetical protein